MIKNVLICGLGAVGITYANKLKDVCNLSILANKDRINRYKKNPLTLNGESLNLNYVTPESKAEQDLIIISTKTNGLASAISYIKNFVGENTIILSLINGIHSEKEIAKTYGTNKVLHSYFIGHSAVRIDNNVLQDGVGKIVFGSPYPENNNKILNLKEFFESNNIDFEIPEDIIYSLWLKYTLNIFSNQTSAIMNLTFGDMKHNKYFINFAKNIIAEVASIAQKEGVNNTENLETDSLTFLSKMIDSGKTSMLQDILASRETEVDIFSGEIIKLGHFHNVDTPYNKILYEMVKIAEEKSKYQNAYVN